MRFRSRLPLAAPVGDVGHCTDNSVAKFSNYDLTVVGERLHVDGSFRATGSITMSPIALRDFRDADAAHVNRVALAAFDQFSSQYSDWPAMSSTVARMSTPRCPPCLATSSSSTLFSEYKPINFLSDG